MEEYSLFVLRKVLIDVVILGLLGGGVYTSTQIQPFQRGFFCGDESILYPYRYNTVTANALHIVGLLLPIVTIVVCEAVTLRRRKEESRRCVGVPLPAWLRGAYSVLATFGAGLLCTELATNISKVTIGRLRPCFMDVCVPNINCSLPENQGMYISPDRFTCTNPGNYSANSLRDIRVSFVSGHSSWAAFTMIYLALYLHRRMTWSGTHLPRYLLQFSVVMLSWFTALSRVSDNKHHWSDVLAGYALGATFAVIAATWCTQHVAPREHVALPQHERTPSVIALGQRS